MLRSIGSAPYDECAMLMDCGWIGWFAEGGANGKPAVNGGRLVNPVAMRAPARSEAET